MSTLDNSDFEKIKKYYNDFRTDLKNNITNTSIINKIGG